MSIRRLPLALPVALGLGLGLVSVPGHADTAVWFDSHNDCGRAAAFAKSGRAADLPGCGGRLPKDAPQVEVVLHDAKRRLVDAEDLLGKNKLDKIDPLLTQVEADLAKTPPVHPDLPDRWEQAEPLYRREIASLRNRRKLAPQLDRLRTTHAAALEADKTRNKKELAGGPADALKAAQACVAAFSEVRSTGIDMSVMVELEKDRPRPLEESGADCERVRRSAETLARAQEQASRARRAQWRKVLKGDRLKTFDEHPTALPEFEGVAEHWRAIAHVAVWTYATPTGHERYTFKGNKLAGRTVEK
ncbi:MAG TPA: hypothetical protein VF997_21055 [Polyangia bacterium]